MTPPNILYLNSHDTGRYVQPYGYPVPTPNIRHLADQGVLFREVLGRARVLGLPRRVAHGAVCPCDRHDRARAPGLPPALYDLLLDPTEGTNRIDDPGLGEVRADLERRLNEWMVRTEHPLLDGPVPPGEGTVFNTVDQISPDEPTQPATARSETHTYRTRISDTASR